MVLLLNSLKTTVAHRSENPSIRDHIAELGYAINRIASSQLYSCQLAGTGSFVNKGVKNKLR